MSALRSLIDIRNRLGMPLDGFAKKIGYAGASSYQRYESDERVSEGYSLTFIQRVAKNVLGEGAPPITLQDIAQLFPNSPAIETEAQQLYLYDLLGIKVPKALAKSSIVARNSVQAIRVSGVAQALFWAPIASSLGGTGGMTSVPFMSTHPIDQQYALRVSGRSFDNRVKDGHYAICFEFDGDFDSLKSGSAVHLERERNHEIETTLRVVKWSSKGLQLHHDSSDPSFDDFVLWNDVAQHSTEKHRIIGVVLGYFAFA